MQSSDIAAMSLAEAAAKVGRREVSPVELTDACIERAEALDPKLNAYFTRTFDAAREAARRATEEIAAGAYRGPLHGIPFALKDLYETAGLRTTAGSPVREDYVPQEDAHAVALLKQAGIVLLGKLNMHEWALGGTNINVFYPTPRNPWALDRVTGGSSGGSGAAIAAGLCFGTLGSDTRGSIRIPASLCGVTGLKATYGRVSIRGVVPLNWSLDHAGPLARGAADCALILQAIAGFDPLDPTTVEVPVPDFSASLEGGLAGVTIGVPRNYFFDPEATEPDVLDRVLATRDVFRSLGAEVIDVDFPDPERFGDNGAFLADASAYHETNLHEHPDKYSPLIHTRLTSGLALSAVEYSRARYRQLELKQELRSLFQSVDLILTPTSPCVAVPIVDDPAAIPVALLPRNTGIYNTAGNPVISVPCGFSEAGLPIGLSLAGRWWEEGAVLRAAHAYQQVTDWHKRVPNLAS